ncbi:hypothetical protein PCE1_001336 [Barthelona sp. PCE]
MNTDHLILLIQITEDEASKTFSEFESVSDLVGSLLTLFETKLASKTKNRKISYTSSEMNDYIDSLYSIGVLSYRGDRMTRPRRPEPAPAGEPSSSPRHDGRSSRGRAECANATSHICFTPPVPCPRDPAASPRPRPNASRAGEI